MSEIEFWEGLAFLGIIQGILIYSWIKYQYHKREAKILKSVNHYPSNHEWEPLSGHRKQKQWQWYLAKEVNEKFHHLTEDNQRQVQKAKEWYIDEYSPELDKLAGLLDALDIELVFCNREDIEDVRRTLDSKTSRLLSWFVTLLSGGALLSIIAFFILRVQDN